MMAGGKLASSEGTAEIPLTQLQQGVASGVLATGESTPSLMAGDQHAKDDGPRPQLWQVLPFLFTPHAWAVCTSAREAVQTFFLGLVPDGRPKEGWTGAMFQQ